MSRLNCTEGELAGKRKRTRHEEFLTEVGETAPRDYLAG